MKRTQQRAASADGVAVCLRGGACSERPWLTVVDSAGHARSSRGCAGGGRDPARPTSTSETSNRTMLIAAAPAGSSFSTWLKIATDATSVLNGMLPEMSTIEPNSPMARAKARPAPVRIAGSSVGSTMRRRIVERRRAEGRGGLLHVQVQLEQHGLDGADRRTAA